jgi:ribosome-associated protein
MDIRKLQRAIVDGLEDVKAQDIVVFNTEALSPLFERVIVASGTSNRQTKALASSVRDAVKASGMQVLRSEGEANGEWIIVDCGAAVVHVMQPSIREYYRLEEIWGGKPVGMKLGGSAKAGDKPASAKKAGAKAAPANHTSVTQAPSRKAPGSKVAGDKKPASRTPAKKTPAKKSPTRQASARAAAVRKVPAKAAPAARSRSASQAAPAPRTPARKAAPAKRPAARKTPRA